MQCICSPAVPAHGCHWARTPDEHTRKQSVKNIRSFLFMRCNFWPGIRDKIKIFLLGSI